MRITVLAYGTRGDVQPMVALAHALQARGHVVRLGAPENHVAFGRATGLEVLPLAGSSEEILGSPEGRSWLERGDVRRLLATMASRLEALADAVERDMEQAVAGSEAIVTGLLSATMARVFSDALGIPMVVAHLHPALPSRELAHAAFDPPDWTPGWALRGLTEGLMWALWRRVHRIDDAIRARRGLPRAAEDGSIAVWRAGRPSVHMWSPTLIPRPSDWPRERLTGFCTLPASLRAPLGEADALEAVRPFLESGPPPIYIGLGSMPVLDSGPKLDVVLRSAERVGARVLLGGTLPDASAIRARLPSWAALVGPIDHERLFPLCRAVVHHGGAGTTAASSRSGRPTLIAPVLGDQWMWGRAVRRHGAGVVLRFQEWTEDRLTRALDALGDGRRIAAAETLGARMRAEPDGAGAAAEAIASILGEGR